MNLSSKSTLFNRNKLQSNRDKAAYTIINCPVFKHAVDDIMQRLHMLDLSFVNILDIGCRNGDLSLALLGKYNDATLIATDMSSEMIKNVECITTKILVDEEDLEFTANQFDLITFSLGLHWINNVPRFLKHIHHWLSPNGIFIANFIGGNSLKYLRHSLIQAEIESGHDHSQHISPFINFDHMVPLLKQAGFQDIIIDTEEIHLEYKSAYGLMRAIKMAGESNILYNMPKFSISKKMFTLLNIETIFHDQLNMISFIVSKTRSAIKL